MDENKNGSFLPDISGVFDVNDSDIPDRLLDKPKQKNTARQEEHGVIFTDRTTKEEQLKQQRTVRRRGNAKKLRRLRKRRLTAAAAVIILLAAAVFAVKTAVAVSKRPVVGIYTVTVGSVRSTYSSSAAVVTAAADSSPITTYALIPENSYDLNGIKTGQSAAVTNADGKTYEAHVTAITEENADTALTETVKTALPDKTLSASSNIFIYVKPDAPMNESDGTVLSVTIITAEVNDVTFVPDECIFGDKNGSFVWTVSRFGKVLTKKYVTVSLSANGYTSVVGGLKKNERVVCKTVTDTAERPLSDGLKVRIASSEDSEVTTAQ